MMNFALENLAEDTAATSAASNATIGGGSTVAADTTSAHRKPHSGGGTTAGGGGGGVPRSKSAAAFTASSAAEEQQGLIMMRPMLKPLSPAAGAALQRGALQLRGEGGSATSPVNAIAGGGAGPTQSGSSRRSLSSPQPQASGDSGRARPPSVPKPESGGNGPLVRPLPLASPPWPVPGLSVWPTDEGADGGTAREVEEEEEEEEEGELPLPPSQCGPTCWHDVAVTVIWHPRTGR